MIFAGLGSAEALAQFAPVRLRVSPQDGLERLVFDTGAARPYTVKKESGNRLVIAFSGAGTLDQSAAPSNYAQVKSIEVLSQDPLTVAVTLNEGAKAKDFRLGGRVMLDISGGASPASAPPAAKKPEVQTAPVTKPPEAKPEPSVPAPPPPSAPPAVSPEAKPVEEIKPAEEPVVTAPDEALLKAASSVPEAAPQIGDNLVSVASSNSSAMAVFEHGGDVWLINSDENMLINPQVSGPQAAQLKLEPVNLPQTKSFRLQNLPGAFVRGQGGGLVWRVLIGPKPSPEKPVLPQAVDVKPGEARGGALIWPLRETSEVLNLADPVTGRTLKIITVGNAKQFAGPARRYIDFDVLPSAVGLVILPKVDDLEVSLVPEGVKVTRPGGLAISAAPVIADVKTETPASAEEKKPEQITTKPPQDKRRVFDFKNWQMGGTAAIDQNRTIVFGDMADASKEIKIEGLVNLARMYLANGLAAEANGLLDFAQDELPDLMDNPQFRALRGAAQALAFRSENAFDLLSDESLKPFEEIGFWRAFALADLGDWQQAYEVLPKSNATMAQYPAELQSRMVPALAEVALRAGDSKLGGAFLSLIGPITATLNEPQKAAYEYLKGEAARQKGDFAATKKAWEPLTKGRDDLYRAKAGLALSRLLIDRKEMKPDQAIDTLERLRYSWRGDQLEAQINYWLGKTYFEAGQYVKGLNIMKDAANYAGDSGLADSIRGEMTDTFVKLFTTEELKKVSPLDAAALYEQFRGFVPADARGDAVTQKLADHLVRSDLLERAGNLLQQQLDHRLQGLEAYKVAVRLAAIRLLDDKPSRAMETLNKAKTILAELPEELKTPQRSMEIALLRARSLSQLGRPDQAIELLRNLPAHVDVNRLKADIAWNAQYWEDAGIALDEVIEDLNISLTRPLSGENAALILQRALALNLANDRIGLSNMREKYLQAMSQTEKSRIFEVITRPRQSAALADRETLMQSVSEVDLFGDFLNSYMAADSQNKAKENPAPPPPAAP